MLSMVATTCHIAFLLLLFLGLAKLPIALCRLQFNLMYFALSYVYCSSFSCIKPAQ